MRWSFKEFVNQTVNNEEQIERVIVNKKDEILMVTVTDARAQPRTMVVSSQDTTIAFTAVICSGWKVALTFRT